MARTLLVVGPPGANRSVVLFAEGADTIADSSVPTAGANDTVLHTVTLDPGLAAGRYRVEFKSGTTTIITDHATIGSADGEYKVDDLKELSLSSSTVFVLTLAGAEYANRDLLELMFGVANIAEWADIDNDEDTDKIDNRIAWCLQLATEQTNSKLREAQYTLPVDPVPLDFASIVAGLAGAILYEGRGALESNLDGEGRHIMSFHRDRWDNYVRDLISGRVVLSGQGDRALGAPSIT